MRGVVKTSGIVLVLGLHLLALELKLKPAKTLNHSDRRTPYPAAKN